MKFSVRWAFHRVIPLSVLGASSPRFPGSGLPAVTPGVTGQATGPETRARDASPAQAPAPW